MIPDDFKSARLVYQGLDGKDGEDTFLRQINANQFRSKPTNEFSLKMLKVHINHVKQLGIQLLEAVIGFTWSFVGSYILFALIDCVPGLEVLAKDE